MSRPALLADLYHYFGNDLSVSSTGDLLVATGTARGQQRVIRRLLTSPGGYIWEPTYGAGLPQYVGRPLDIAKVSALIIAQMLLEDSVARSPIPVVKVLQSNADLTLINVQVNYNDQPTNQPVVLSFTVGKSSGN